MLKKMVQSSFKFENSILKSKMIVEENLQNTMGEVYILYNFIETWSQFF